MRTFEQYIEEAYSFRLGGSQKKGFDQNGVKTFRKLEEGDIIYRYFKFSGDDGEAETVQFLSINKHFRPEGSKNSSVEFIKYEGKHEESGWYNAKTADLDNTTIVLEDSKRLKSIISTSEEEFLEKVEEIAGDKNIEIQNHSEKLEESYSFRLGGSQKKGFDQKDRTKTFGELHEDDVFYSYDKDEDSVPRTFVVKAAYKLRDNIRITYTYPNNKYTYAIEISTKKANEKVEQISSHRIVGTDSEAFLRKVGTQFGPSFKESDIEGIDEAYNFRLGGSQQKGFEQTKHKTFAELEKGDTVYFYFIDSSSRYHYIAECKVALIDNTRVCFDNVNTYWKWKNDEYDSSLASYYENDELFSALSIDKELLIEFLEKNSIHENMLTVY